MKYVYICMYRKDGWLNYYSDYYAARTLRLRASMESRRLDIPPTPLAAALFPEGADVSAESALWQSGQTRELPSARPLSTEEECCPVRLVFL